MKVSVLVLTLDEEVNLTRCLASLGWCDDIVVLDSFSKDATKEIALSQGVRFAEREFDDYAKQRQFGLERIEYRHPWVLMVDADEVVSPELADEILNVLEECGTEICLYRMRRKDFFMGRWMRRCSGYPTWFGRLVRVGRVRVDRPINEEYHTTGGIRHLMGHLLHYPFNKGFYCWFDKHNKYSSMEAELIIRESGQTVDFRSLLNNDPVVFRRALKGAFYKVPLRPLLMFIALYFIRGGFLDGRAGLIFCLLRSFYEFMIGCKVKEDSCRRNSVPL
jgi:glycosyltransferase involved in cell wall biosynthesis